jgi:cytochrome c oxidase subunit II
MTRARLGPPLALGVALAAGCAGEQAVLAPAAPGAADIAALGVRMFAGGAAILALVLALLGLALFGGERPRRWLRRESSVVLLGLVFPGVALSALLLHGLVTTRALLADDGAPDVVVEVVGEQWWWRVRYSEGGPAFETANQIHLPADARVELRLRTADVIHSFWVPRLAGKVDMIPGRVNRLRLRTGAPGTYRGQCAEYCGGAHARMAFHVVVQSAAEFRSWREREASAALEPRDAHRQRGRDAFLAAGCGGCHAIRGTAANGVLGPDLTHVGARAYLAAGMFPNHAGTLAGWIASSQHLKPGNGMPSQNVFQGAELRALADYLVSLR